MVNEHKETSAKEKIISRRAFLGLAGAAGLSVALGGCSNSNPEASGYNPEFAEGTNGEENGPNIIDEILSAGETITRPTNGHYQMTGATFYQYDESGNNSYIAEPIHLEVSRHEKEGLVKGFIMPDGIVYSMKGGRWIEIKDDILYYFQPAKPLTFSWADGFERVSDGFLIKRGDNSDERIGNNYYATDATDYSRFVIEADPNGQNLTIKGISPVNPYNDIMPNIDVKYFKPVEGYGIITEVFFEKISDE